MKTKGTISLNEAIEEAINLGFRNRYVLHNSSIYSLLTNSDFPESDYAVVESYPVLLKSGHKGYIHYIVLNNGQLGFMLEEAKKTSPAKEHIQQNGDVIQHSLENSFRE